MPRFGPASVFVPALSAAPAARAGPAWAAEWAPAPATLGAEAATAALAVVVLGLIVYVLQRRRAGRAAGDDERRLRAAIDSMREPFALFDADDRLVDFNAAYRTVYPDADAALERRLTFKAIIRDVVAKGLIAGIEGREERCIAERLAAHRDPGTPTILRFADGRWHIVTETRTREGGIALLFTDITGLKRAEEESRHAKEAAEIANRTKTEFLANISHELRTPLNSIIGFSSMLREEPFASESPPKALEYAGDIQASGLHLLQLINDILDISHIEAGTTELQEDEIDPRDPVDEAVKMIERRAGEKGLFLTRAFPESCPRLRADPRYLRQVVVNLLSNAVKFTPPGGHVTIDIDSDAGGLTLSVADTGVGMALDDIPKALEPFGQVGDAFTRGEDGTGLGLPLSLALMELHGGTLEIDSAPGEGTTVRVRFPPERVIPEHYRRTAE